MWENLKWRLTDWQLFVSWETDFSYAKVLDFTIFFGFNCDSIILCLLIIIESVYFVQIICTTINPNWWWVRVKFFDLGLDHPPLGQENFPPKSLIFHFFSLDQIKSNWVGSKKYPGLSWVGPLINCGSEVHSGKVISNPEWGNHHVRLFLRLIQGSKICLERASIPGLPILSQFSLPWAPTSDGSWSKFFDLGWVGSIFCGLDWVRLGKPIIVWASPKNIKFLYFFPFGSKKKSLWVRSKSTRVKGGLPISKFDNLIM